MKLRTLYHLVGWNLTASFGLLSCATGLEIDNAPQATDEDASIGADDGDGGIGSGPPIIDDGLDDEPPMSCGDGELADTEACDDGNTADGDGCSADCGEIADDYVCAVAGQPCTLSDRCGDGRPAKSEDCDDGNVIPADGCTAGCQIEAGWACPEPGKPCVFTVDCGDGKVGFGEQCDDGNDQAADGCDNTCQVSPGWKCSVPGQRCEAAMCGDSIVAGAEQCDDGNAVDGDGCNANCNRETGYVCEQAGELCRATVCGDGEVEGDEPCDDGDDIHSGDGCSPGCILEPNCTGGGACASSCGDGLVLPSDEEDCDDGNLQGGDGCSMMCMQEPGWKCDIVAGKLPESLEIPVVYRDFIHAPAGDGDVRHPDFEAFYEGADRLDRSPGMVEDSLSWLPMEPGLPVYTGLCEAGNASPECPYGAQTTSRSAFDQWYRDDATVNIPLLETLTFARQGNSAVYVFDVGDTNLFPFDDKGWVAAGKELQTAENENTDAHNYGFTTELRYWFEYQGGESLEFIGDDDVWVFIGGKLAVDIGGLHEKVTYSTTLNEGAAADLGLVKGNVYEIALFHAERHSWASNFKLTLGGFVSTETVCDEICGDGLVVGDEVCDEGEENSEETGEAVEYGKCAADCRSRGPVCGDAQVQMPQEQCDNGINLDLYQLNEQSCGAGCKLPGSCGDGNVDGPFGEECDRGDDNDDALYGGCTTTCKLGPRCGDGVKQEPEEQCDDGNQRNGDGCTPQCTIPRIIMN